MGGGAGVSVGGGAGVSVGGKGVSVGGNSFVVIGDGSSGLGVTVGSGGKMLGVLVADGCGVAVGWPLAGVAVVGTWVRWAMLFCVGVGGRVVGEGWPGRSVGGNGVAEGGVHCPLAVDVGGTMVGGRCGVAVGGATMRCGVWVGSGGVGVDEWRMTGGKAAGIVVGVGAGVLVADSAGAARTVGLASGVALGSAVGLTACIVVVGVVVIISEADLSLPAIRPKASAATTAATIMSGATSKSSGRSLLLAATGSSSWLLLRRGEALGFAPVTRCGPLTTRVGAALDNTCEAVGAGGVATIATAAIPPPPFPGKAGLPAVPPPPFRRRAGVRGASAG